MYNSLREWCNVTVQLLKSAGYNYAGDENESPSQDIKCYPVEMMQVITDKTGTEYVSTTQLYVPNDYVITEADLICYNGNTYEIRKLGCFIEGSDGMPSIRVCYL